MPSVHLDAAARVDGESSECNTEEKPERTLLQVLSSILVGIIKALYKLNKSFHALKHLFSFFLY